MIKGKNYINGEFIDGNIYFDKINPSDLEIIGKFPKSDKLLVEEVVKIAKNSQKLWKNISKVKRGEYFDNLCQRISRRKDEIAHLISKETGKNLNESYAEVIEALHMAQFTFGKSRMPSGEIIPSELSERDSYVIRKPKGVVAVISPWNFPFAIGGFWCAAPSLLEGNTVVFKPSELTPMTGQLIAELYHEAGFPNGVFNLIHGDGETGKYLVESDINHICFTGSVEVGKEIRKVCAESRDKTCSCEMGSKSAVIVFEDADLDLAVQACLNSAFKLSGQRCVSAGRLIVQRSILEQFKEKFIEQAKKVYIGEPFGDGCNDCTIAIGPVISLEQKERINKYVDMIKKEQNDILILGDELNGCFISPTVFQSEWKDKSYLKEEIFGPVVAIVPFDLIDDAIRIYNDTDYGLAVGICTNNYRIMRKMRDECDAGMIYFNLGSIGAESSLPFGGVKMSGYGHGSAAATFDAVVHQVAVTYNHAEIVTFPQGLK